MALAVVVLVAMGVAAIGSVVVFALLWPPNGHAAWWLGEAAVLVLLTAPLGLGVVMTAAVAIGALASGPSAD